MSATNSYNSIPKNPESFVTGYDKRKQMSPDTNPSQWICQVRATFPDGSKAASTGWLTDKRTVVMSGHGVYDPSCGGMARKVKIQVSLSPRNSYSYKVLVNESTAWCHTKWINDHDCRYDYAFIRLDDLPKDNPSKFVITDSLADDEISRLRVKIAGYPGDKPEGTIWVAKGSIAQVESHRIYYPISTFGGQSGSPIWFESDNKYHVIGIHTDGFIGQSNRNSGIRITNEFSEDFKTFMQSTQ